MFLNDQLKIFSQRSTRHPQFPFQSTTSTNIQSFAELKCCCCCSTKPVVLDQGPVFGPAESILSNFLTGRCRCQRCYRIVTSVAQNLTKLVRGLHRFRSICEKLVTASCLILMQGLTLIFRVYWQSGLVGSFRPISPTRATDRHKVRLSK